MIDFLSTRPGVRPEDHACLQLFAAVIAQAVKDVFHEPNKAEKAGKGSLKTMNKDALDALRFLFALPSSFDWYADIVGVDAIAMRRALLVGDFAKGPGGILNEMQARLFRMRLRWSGLDYQRWLN